MAFKPDVMSQHHSPKDTKGRSRNVCEKSTTELHWYLFYPSLLREGPEQERLWSEEGTGLALLLQWICYSFSCFLILFLSSQVYTPSAIICFPSFRQGPLQCGSVPVWSYGAFAKIFQQNSGCLVWWSAAALCQVLDNPAEVCPPEGAFVYQFCISLKEYINVSKNILLWVKSQWVLLTVLNYL